MLPADSDWADLSSQFTIYPSTRQLIVADITRVQTSCGFGVPLFEYVGEREHHWQWGRKGRCEVYQRQHSLRSIDGLPTVLGVRKAP